MKRPELQHRPLTIAEAAEYLGYRTTAGIRGLVKKKLLKTCGRGARDQHLFDLEELDLLMVGIDRPVTVHGIRHSFHDLARQQGVPDAVVKAMAGRAGAEVAQRGQDKHLHYSRGVTVEEMRRASMALMQLVPPGPVAGPKSRGEGRDGSGRDRESDDELAVTTTP